MRKVSLALVCFILLTGISWAQYYPKARQIATNTTNFDGVLSGTDTDVQKALETIDAISLAGTGNVTAEGFVADQVLFGSSTTGIKGSANLIYNTTIPSFNISNGNLTFLFSRTADQWFVNQSNTAGTEWVSGNPTGLIWIDDNRAGTTVSEKEEASLVVTGDGTYSAYFEDQTYFGNAINAYAGLLMRADDNVAYTSIGADIDIVWAYDLNGAGDDFLSWAIRRQAASDSAAIYLFTDYTNNNPSGDTAHDNYISPTFVLLNSNGADGGDYSAVVIGERTQSNVATTHYFDFYAMTGASDGGVNAATTEIAPMFRIGDSGTATSGHSLSSGDVLFEDDVEINGMLWADGGVTGALTGNADTATALAGGEVDPTVDTSAEIMAIIGADAIKDTHIDWGTGANQVSSDDVPVGATNIYFNKTAESGTLALKNQTKSISIYNITASHDVLLWQTPKAITITNVSMACTGGTDVVAVLQECNVTGQTCVNLNTTFWQTLAGQGTSVDDFNDAAIAANAWLALNTTTVNGTPSNWGMTVKFDEN